MTTIARSASGASFYSRTNILHHQWIDEKSPFLGDGSGTPEQSWLRAIDELLRIRKLEDDWDGEGGEAPHPFLVDGAITLAQFLEANSWSAPDRVHASVNATVYFEWFHPIGYCEIEVTSPLEAECRWVRQGSDHPEVISFVRQS